MELNIILAVITFILLSVMGLAIYLIPSTKKNAATTKEPVAEVEGKVGRLDAARNQRARMRANAARQRHDVNPEEDNHAVEDNRAEAEDQDVGAGDGKLGAKKRAKLEAKAERKAAREADERIREVKKAQDEKDEEERKRLEEIEKAEEMKRAELERKEIEEREKKEQEEYLQMKAAFSVEGEGFEDEGENDTGKNLLQEFVHYIRANKVVVIEDLAAHFKLKTQAAIDRISTLQADGILTGVVDDRGKFIYISQEELENVAKFIKQRGRVSITDLVESSNELINLVPVPV